MERYSEGGPDFSEVCCGTICLYFNVSILSNTLLECLKMSVHFGHLFILNIGRNSNLVRKYIVSRFLSAHIFFPFFAEVLWSLFWSLFLSWTAQVQLLQRHRSNAICTAVIYVSAVPHFWVLTCVCVWWEKGIMNRNLLFRRKYLRKKNSTQSIFLATKNHDPHFFLWCTEDYFNRCYSPLQL